MLFSTKNQAILEGIITSTTFALSLFIPIQSHAQNTSIRTDVEVLKAQIQLLQDVNTNILNSVYWTLGVLAAIFIAVISVNLYFNIIANKKEIRKIKEDTLTNAESKIEKAESKLLEKINSQLDERFKRESDNIFNRIQNEFLTYQATVNKKLEEIQTKLVENTNHNGKIDESISDIKINVRELQGFRYSQLGTIGAYIAALDVLEHDIQNRTWHIPFTLKTLLKEIQDDEVPKEIADRFLLLLDRVPENQDTTPIKEEIRKTMKIEKLKIES